MNHSLKLKKPLAFFDLETTGIDIVNDRIVEISMLKAMPDGSCTSKTMRINPEMPIPVEASAVHGIYDEDVKDCPTFRKAVHEIISFLEGCDLAGYNSVKFDLPLLVEECMRVMLNSTSASAGWWMHKKFSTTWSPEILPLHFVFIVAVK
jgi:DNA polymerase-3 subunit epsilon